VTRAALALACALALGACAKPAPAPGHRVGCRCTYLTDFDDTATVDVQVCARDGRPVLDEARACAGQAAHNHVERCECAAPGDPCDARASDACSAR